ncbi:MAG: flagellar biosynthesis protein FlhF [Gammaproteobacteria bacterium]|nr:flagellar biosynthesis protein FlhF [Gammaproteobacteria bacterium]
MKIKRFLAKNMRQAIGLVRAEQGPDAVILSNQRTPDGIEIISAVDYDEALIHQALGQVLETSVPHSAEKSATDAEQKNGYPEIETVVAPDADERPGARRRKKTSAQKPGKTETPTMLAGVGREINTVRKLLETQLSSLAWNNFSRKQPLKATVLRDLTGLGLTRDLAMEIAETLPPVIDDARAARLPMGLLAKRIQTANDDVLRTGGVVAVVGPTGVGKTTTAAKLAARFAMRHGRRDVALVTTDLFRIGGQEQLFTYGRLLGVPAFVASDARELSDTLARLSDKKFVVIDNAGMSQRDVRIAEQLSLLCTGGSDIQIYLTISANNQVAVLEDTVRSFGRARLDGCVLTKLDEATNLGGALSVLVRHKLPVAYITDGQRVPEDIRSTRAHQLVAQAVKLRQGNNELADENTMADIFGGAVYAVS